MINGHYTFCNKSFHYMHFLYSVFSLCYICHELSRPASKCRLGDFFGVALVIEVILEGSKAVACYYREIHFSKQK